MRTDALVESLAAQAKARGPQPYRPVGRAFALWCGAALMCVAAGTMLLGPRADLGQQLLSPRFLIETASVLACVAVAGFGALGLSIPGRLRSDRFTLLIAFLVALWVGGLAAAALRFGVPQAVAQIDDGSSCTFATFGLAALPALLLGWMVRSRAPTDPGLAATAIGVAGFAAGAVGLLIHCPIDNAVHHLVWHALPVAGVAAIAAIAGRRLLRW